MQAGIQVRVEIAASFSWQVATCEARLRGKMSLAIGGVVRGACSAGCQAFTLSDARALGVDGSESPKLEMAPSVAHSKSVGVDRQILRALIGR